MITLIAMITMIITVIMAIMGIKVHQGHLRVEVAAGSNCPSSTCITAALSEG